MYTICVCPMTFWQALLLTATNSWQAIVINNIDPNALFTKYIHKLTSFTTCVIPILGLSVQSFRTYNFDQRLIRRDSSSKLRMTYMASLGFIPVQYGLWFSGRFLLFHWKVLNLHQIGSYWANSCDKVIYNTSTSDRVYLWIVAVVVHAAHVLSLVIDETGWGNASWNTVTDCKPTITRQLRPLHHHKLGIH